MCCLSLVYMFTWSWVCEPKKFYIIEEYLWISFKSASEGLIYDSLRLWAGTKTEEKKELSQYSAFDVHSWIKTFFKCSTILQVGLLDQALTGSEWDKKKWVQVLYRTVSFFFNMDHLILNNSPWNAAQQHHHEEWLIVIQPWYKGKKENYMKAMFGN